MTGTYCAERLRLGRRPQAYLEAEQKDESTVAEEQQDELNFDVPAASEAPAEDVPAKKPAARTRRRKAAEDAPASEGAKADAAPAPKKRATRKPRAKKTETAAVEAPVSDEIAQARALAQISQAAVARRERARAEAAAETVAEGGATAVEAAPAPKKRATRKPRTKKADAAVEAAAADAPAATDAPAIASDAPAEEAPRTRRRRAAKADADDSAAEKAPADGAGEKASNDTDNDASDAPKQDVRPGRRRRAEAEKAAAADGDKAADDKQATKAAEQDAGEEGGNRRRQRDRRNNNDRNNNGNNGGDRNDRGGRNNKRDRKNRNNRFNVPSEPTLTRDELSGMKVAELREKGKELDLDVTGKKKADLIEEIYLTAARLEGFREIEGILDLANDGHGYIRAHGYMPSRDDAFVPANLVRGARLRAGDLIAGTLRPSRANDKFPGLAKIKTVNGLDPEEIRRRPKFNELTPIYPNEPLKMEHGKDSITGRAIDIVSPIGKGQRGLIVSPPKAGKTTILKKICQSIAVNNPEVHLICLLVDERPEEVTDMERSIKGDVVASTFDMPADNHTRVSELVIERAKRIVEMGGDVVVVLDSITRLARAYNLAAPASGRILSGGVDSAALYPPKKFLGAARNIENGGSLTILASALVETGSKMDEVIFEEFKGTGNMELKLDRDLADRRIFPAIDPVASGTRNEDLLVDEAMRPFVWGIRRILANMNNTERAAASFIKGLKNTDTNQEFLIRTAKKAQDL